MPKIFVLRNRLQEQQARLLETQKGRENNSVGGIGNNKEDEEDDQPVALISKKSQDIQTSPKDNSLTTGKYWLNNFKSRMLRQGEHSGGDGPVSAAVTSVLGS